MIVFDGHNDSLKKTFLERRSFLLKSTQGHMDLARAREGGLCGGIFAVQVPPQYPEQRVFRYGLSVREDGWEVIYPEAIPQQYAAEFVDEVLDYFFKTIEGSAEIRILRTYDDIRDCPDEKELAIMFHLEGAEAIAEDLSNLDYYYDLGIRSIGIVWSRPNVFGYGVPFRFPAGPDTGPGLTESGKKLVRRCNELGIIIDLTHLNERGFWDVTQLSTAPLVVSHGNVHAICPSTTNLLDSQIDAVAQSSGIIGINFDVLNIRRDGKLVSQTPLDVIMEHIDYIVSKAGPEYVGFGSDFDGGQMPTALSDVAKLPDLLEALARKGYGDQILKKIAYQNWHRIIRQTWAGRQKNTLVAGQNSLIPS